MKLKNLFSTAFLAALMIMPMIVNAADRDDKQNRRDKDSYTGRKRDDNRRDNDRRDNDRRDNDRRDNDRWGQNGGHDNGNHNGWDKNGKSGSVNYNSRHDDWHRSSRSTHRDDCRYDSGNWRQYDTRYNTRYNDRYDNDRYDNDRYGSYNTRHDDWHRSSRSSHRDDCRYDGGNWRQQDTRYNTRYNDPYYNDRNRNDPYYGGGYEYDRREQTKNEWKNLGIAGGVLAVLGLLNNDSTLTFAGAAGALYSAYRYEQDRKSQNRVDRARAYYFSQPYFNRDGHRYERRDVNRNGQRYYQFVRCD